MELQKTFTNKNKVKNRLIAIITMRAHIKYMSRCIELGKEALQNGNPPVGSILVKNDVVIGVGKESVKLSNDVTRHAEIEAIKDALINHQSLNDSTLYTTHEPCVMCSYVIRYYKIKTVVYGTKSSYVGGLTSKYNILEEKDIPKWESPPKIIQGILENECIQLSRTYKNILK